MAKMQYKNVGNPINIEYGTGDISFKLKPSERIHGIQIGYNGTPTMLELEDNGENWVFHHMNNVILGYFNSLEEGHLEKRIATYAGDLDITYVKICDNTGTPYRVKIDKITGLASRDKSIWSTSNEKVDGIKVNKNIRKLKVGK